MDNSGQKKISYFNWFNTFTIHGTHLSQNVLGFLKQISRKLESIKKIEYFINQLQLRFQVKPIKSKQKQ